MRLAGWKATQRAPSLLAGHQAPLPAPGSQAPTAVLRHPTPAGLGQCTLGLIKDGTVQLAKPTSFRAFTSPNGALLCLLQKKIKERLHKKSHVSQLRPQNSSVVAQVLSKLCPFPPLALSGGQHCPRLRDNNELLSVTVCFLCAGHSAKRLKCS